MLSIEGMKEHMENILPFHLKETMIRELFYCCSSITFHDSGESLFKKGDAPKGFYWILSGNVLLNLNQSPELKIGKGNFIGLDNFVSGQPHHFEINTSEKLVETLFIDQRCYESLFLKEHQLSTYVLQKHLSQLMELKNWIELGAIA